METLIVHPQNKEQTKVLKAFMKALKISFKEEKEGYDPEFVAKVQESRAQIKRGETRIVDISEL